MRAQIDAPKYTYLKRGVYYFVTVLAITLCVSSSALEPNVVDNSLTPIRPWSSTTISFDSLVVGAMLAGLYFPIGLTFTFIGIALILRLMFRTRSHLGRDPNARFHDLFTALADAGAALAAYAIANCPFRVSHGRSRRTS